MKIAIPIIHEDVKMLENRLKLEKDFRRKPRLHMLYLLKSGSCQTRLEVAETLAIHRNTIGHWLKRYEHGGLNALMTIEEPGAKPGQKTLPQEAMDSLKERLKEESGFRSYGEIQMWLFQTHRLEVNYKTVYRIVRYDMKAKLKVPRKSHKKKNEQEVEDFKENVESHLLGAMGDNPVSCVQIQVQDESRFGLLPSRISIAFAIRSVDSQRRITAKGTKPIQVVNPRYESYYLYGAVAPGTGEHLFLEMPALNSSCFEVFIEQLAITYPQDYNIVILDNASFHKTSELIIPENVGFLFLPPYAPELNPIERLWQVVKEDIAFQLHETLSSLKDNVASILKKLTASEVASITGYPYLIHAINALSF